MSRMFIALAAAAIPAAFVVGATLRVMSQPIPPPRAVQCNHYVAIDQNGKVQHYEDCTPTDGQIMRCEVLNATDAAGRVRKIQNCALVTPADPNK